jgi:hypothetical protein
MAVVTPLKWDGSSLKEMDSTDINNIKTEMIRQYASSPSVTLTVEANGDSGSLSGGPLADTKMIAGAASTSSTAFPDEATTAEPTVATGTSFEKVKQQKATVSTPADTDNKRFPVYLDGATIQAMSLQDMIDTFADPVIDTLTNGSLTTAQAGTYRIHTATTLSGATQIVQSSSGPDDIVFQDTGADTSLYTAAGIPETLDQTLVLQNYYLFQVDAASVGTIPTPMYINSNDDLQQFATATFQTILQEVVRHTAVNVVGSRIDYNYTTGTNLGSSMVDQRLDGAGNYQTLQASTSDYRAQEFPNGSLQTISTYNLKVQQT